MGAYSPRAGRKIASGSSASICSALYLAAHIRHVVNEREGHLAPRVRFESELEDHLNPSDTEKTLRAVIGWARYAELFTYDDQTRTFKTGNGSAR